jgi:solute carrier family 25 carnitine/acylcarnitine transporter 20/29
MAHASPDVSSIEIRIEVERPVWLDGAIGFFAGGAYGVTSVIVGQPLDTIKTRMQARPDSITVGPLRVAAGLARSQGLSGLYRGGMPVMLGGTLFRSAQFGVYEVALKSLQEQTPSHRFFGALDWQVAAAGAAGGVARGLIEAPFDSVKVSRQVEQKWSLNTLFRGSGVTIGRNAGLFCAFSIYRDILPPLVPGGLSPFWMGATCSNLAWLTIWPLDVVKSQRQSGLYPGHSSWALLLESARGGLLLRGVVPGLARSTLANGCAMVAYKRIEELANTQLPSWR